MNKLIIRLKYQSVESSYWQMAWRWPNNNNTIFVKVNQDQQCDNINNIKQDLPSNVTTLIYITKYTQQSDHINILKLNSPNNFISNWTKDNQKAGSEDSGLIHIKYSTVY